MSRVEDGAEAASGIATGTARAGRIGQSVQASFTNEECDARTVRKNRRYGLVGKRSFLIGARMLGVLLTEPQG